MKSKPQDYKNQKLLGQGQYGKAYLVDRASDGCKCVIKQIQMDFLGEEQRASVMKEANVLQILNHPNIIKYHEHYKSKKGRLCIVMDYADGGDLNEVINKAKHSTHISEDQILNWLVQLSSALSYVHAKNIIHRDIKANNVLLTSKGIAKLADFGIARVLQSTNDMAHTFLGTPYYIAPEIIENRPYTTKADIWSLGVLIYTLCALKTPFDAYNMQELMFKITKASYPPLPSHYSKELRSLVSELLTLDPEKRPSAQEILDQHRSNCLLQLERPLMKSRVALNVSDNHRIDEIQRNVISRHAPDERRPSNLPNSQKNHLPSARFFSPQNNIELMNQARPNSKMEVRKGIRIGGDQPIKNDKEEQEQSAMLNIPSLNQQPIVGICEGGGSGSGSGQQDNSANNPIRKQFRVNSPINKIGSPSSRLIENRQQVTEKEMLHPTHHHVPSSVNSQVNRQSNLIEQKQQLNHPNIGQQQQQQINGGNRIGSPGTRLPHLSNPKPHPTKELKTSQQVSSGETANHLQSHINRNLNLDKLQKPINSPRNGEIVSPKYSKRPSNILKVQNPLKKLESQLSNAVGGGGERVESSQQQQNSQIDVGLLCPPQLQKNVQENGKQMFPPPTPAPPAPHPHYFPYQSPLQKLQTEESEDSSPENSQQNIVYNNINRLQILQNSSQKKFLIKKGGQQQASQIIIPQSQNQLSGEELIDSEFGSSSRMANITYIQGCESTVNSSKMNKGDFNSAQPSQYDATQSLQGIQFNYEDVKTTKKVLNINIPKQQQQQPISTEVKGIRQDSQSDEELVMLEHQENRKNLKSPLLHYHNPKQQSLRGQIKQTQRKSNQGQAIDEQELKKIPHDGHDKETKIERKIIYKLPFQELDKQRDKEKKKKNTDNSCDMKKESQQQQDKIDFEKILNEFNTQISPETIHSGKELEVAHVPTNKSNDEIGMKEFDNNFIAQSTQAVSSNNISEYKEDRVYVISLNSKSFDSNLIKQIKSLRQLLEKEIGTIHFQKVYNLAVTALDANQQPNDNPELSRNLKIMFPSISSQEILRYTTLFHTLVMLDQD